MNRRNERVSGLLHEELGRLLLEGLHDPRLGQLVTVTGTPTGGPSTAGAATLRAENWVVTRRIMLSGGFRF